MADSGRAARRDTRRDSRLGEGAEPYSSGPTGLLKGKKATTHRASVQFLKYFGATFVGERVVADGKVVSAAGLTAGIDGAVGD